MYEDIIQFIENFKKQRKEAIEYVFQNGNCYWFSVVLIALFGGEAYYLPIKNHFITKIDGKYYDITGEITEFDEEPMNWLHFCEADPKWADRIYRYCVKLQD